MRTNAHLLSTQVPISGAACYRVSSSPTSGSADKVGVRLCVSNGMPSRAHYKRMRSVRSDAARRSLPTFSAESTVGFRPPLPVLLLALLFCPGLSQAVLNSQDVDFSHYQPILDRMPFGQLPANFGQVAADPVQAQTEAQVQAEKEKLAKQVNMSCVNVTPSGKVAIGFTDLSDKTPVNYYLVVGATGGGWTVLDANYDEEWAQIKKGDITITLKLGQGLVDAPPAAVAPEAHKTVLAIPKVETPVELPHAGIVHRPSQANKAPGQLFNTSRLLELRKTRDELAQIRSEGGDVKSYMDRLTERRQQEHAEKAAAEQAARDQLQELARKITDEELKKKEREVNLQLIEQGARPISNIELTPEEEAALVEKGVLAQ